ncbi:hypothetical protein [Legionella maioricensis]|uniref:Uncharacterized protein n=1 Tax=Legionella maioricensis TaxID=2896528 RepID=A0A9X2IAK6_9GAMM|nr:hypothetical protein [Legionella maioricensis]MCL9683705.1 hypothetical protein [Legionella maioricensis]MCL9687479.1 hypothetical protein [Legionella maioricensis]
MTPEKLALLINEKYPKEVFFKPKYQPTLESLPEVDHEDEDEEVVEVEEVNHLAPPAT